MSLELEHQHLEPRLLATAQDIVRALGGVGESVASQRGHGALHALAGNAVEDHVDHDLPGEIEARLKLREEAGRDARANNQLTPVGISLAGQQAHQFAFTRSVGPEDTDSLAEVDLVRERRHESRDRKRLQVQHSARGVAAAHSHDVRRVGDGVRRWPTLADRRHRVSAASAFIAQSLE